MTASIRYKKVLGDNAAVQTINSIAITDGDDKKIRWIDRVLDDGDIGNGAGQTQDAPGAIVEVLPTGINVLGVYGSTYRDGQRIDNLTLNAGADIANISYFYNPGDNTIRVYDQGNNAGVLLATGDIVVVTLITGSTPATY